MFLEPVYLELKIKDIMASNALSLTSQPTLQMCPVYEKPFLKKNFIIACEGGFILTA